MQLSFEANPASPKTSLADSTILKADVNSPFSGFRQKKFLNCRIIFFPDFFALFKCILTAERKIIRFPLRKRIQYLFFLMIITCLSEIN